MANRRGWEELLDDALEPFLGAEMPRQDRPWASLTL